MAAARRFRDRRSVGLLEPAWLASLAGLEAELFVARFGGDSALGGALEVAFHNEVGLINFFQGVGLFAYGDGEGTDADGSAAEFDDDGVQDAFVHFIQPVFVNFKHGEGLVGDLGGDASLIDRKSTRLNSSHIPLSRMPSH